MAIIDKRKYFREKFLETQLNRSPSSRQKLKKDFLQKSIEVDLLTAIQELETQKRFRILRYPGVVSFNNTANPILIFYKRLKRINFFKLELLKLSVRDEYIKKLGIELRYTLINECNYIIQQLEILENKFLNCPSPNRIRSLVNSRKDIYKSARKLFLQL